MAGQPLRFFCDEQLGKLARWLRIIGLDAKYQRKIDDSKLLSQARKEQRIILTRVSKLAEKDPQAQVVLLKTNYPAHQLREVVEIFKHQVQIKVFSRCAACNGEIEPVPKCEVESLVPPYVAQTQERFTRCKTCGKIYWQATHRQRVEIQLRDILGELYRPEGEKEK